MTSAFASFFDDAAIFPPGNTRLDVALKAHLARQDEPDGTYVGPFVCDEARLPELRSLLTGPIDVAVVRGPIEVWGRSDDLPAQPTAIEKAWGSGFDVPAGVLLKLRCGGAYVPSAQELATAIDHCVRRDQSFKLTAGLHSAVAIGDDHGFVNVMAAVVAATRGEDPTPVLRAHVGDLDLTSLAPSRRLFHSVGTCDIDQPLTELRALGLVA